MMRLGIILAVLLSAVAVHAEPTVYLVRHAEKQAGTDPGLTTAGQARAQWLADYFADKGIQAVYSTEYKRTRLTAEPTADRLELETIDYDPSDLKAFAQHLIVSNETAVVAGHSNTTPALVNALLSEDRFYPLQDFQYDFIFKITLHEEGPPTVNIEFSEPRSEYAESSHSM